MQYFSCAAIFSAGLFALSWTPAHAEPMSFNVDPGHTFPIFEVSHLGIATQRGRFDRSSGTVILDVEGRTGSAEIRIDARSVSTGNDDLDTLLRGAFYFAVTDHPQILYKANAIRFDGDKPVLIEGALSFLGVTRPLNLRVSGYACIRFPQLRCGADLRSSFKRSEFGLDAMARFVGDEVSLLIQVEMVKP